MRTVLGQLSVAGLCLALAVPLSAQDATKSDAAAKELAAVNRALADMKRDGTYAGLAQRWGVP